MGLLNELAKGQSPDAIAAKMLRRWPRDAGRAFTNHRTLGNYLRDLDRGKNLDWWRKRTQVVRLLAKVLGADEDELAPLLQSPLAEGELAALRFTLVGDLQPLRLATEELFPGLPAEVFASELWTRHWWQVDDRLTREIVAAWHEQHQRAAVRRAATWDDALPNLPRSGRVLLVLDAQAEPVKEALPALASLFLCVVATCPANHNRARVWDTIDDPDPLTWIQPLADWARARGHSDAGLNRPGAREQLIGRLHALSHWCSGPREALELCALFDAAGVLSEDHRELVRRYLVLVWARHEQVTPSQAWLREHGLAALLALAGEATFQHDDAWLAGLSRERWDTLAPAEVRSEDVAGAHALLQRGPVTEDSRRRILAALDPSPRHFLAALVAIGVLTTTPGGLLRLTPRWLARALRQVALADMLAAPWSVWTARLAQPIVAVAAIQDMTRDLEAGRTGRLDEVLAHAEDGEYAHLLALDVCMRAAGHARLHGAELSPARVAALWRRIGAVTRQQPGTDLPYPLFTANRPEGLLGLGSFALACLLLTEVLTPDEAGRFATLWQSDARPDGVRWIVDAVETYFRGTVESMGSETNALLGLGARWLARCGAFGPNDSLNEILLPAWIVRELEADRPDPHLWRYLRHSGISTFLPELMRRHCELQGIEFAPLVARCWRCFDPAGRQGEQHPWFWWARDRPREAALVWQYLPADVMRGSLRPLLLQDHGGITDKVWQLFAAPQWATWLQLIRETDDDWSSSEAWHHIPRESLFPAIADGLLVRFARGAPWIVWRRVGADVLAELPRLRATHPPSVWALLRSAPQEQQSACLAAVLAWLPELDANELDAARFFLHELVATRGPLAPRAWDGLRRLATR